MKRLLGIVAVAALVLPATAQAKGPDRATITGPGLDAAIVLSGYGESGNGTLPDAFVPVVETLRPWPLCSDDRENRDGVSAHTEVNVTRLACFGP